jgi:hypothetical protein
MAITFTYITQYRISKGGYTIPLVCQFHLLPVVMMVGWQILPGFQIARSELFHTLFRTADFVDNFPIKFSCL